MINWIFFGLGILMMACALTGYACIYGCPKRARRDEVLRDVEIRKWKITFVGCSKRKELRMNGEGKTYGYARVSSKDQNLDRQLCALEEFGVDRGMIYCDKMSGKDFNRPSYRKLMRKLKPGDVLAVKSIDRLGRNYNEILEEWRVVTKAKNVSIVVLDMPLLDTRESKEGITGVFIADLVLQLLSYVAQVERENIKSRQAEGIEAAKARGVRFGRPRIPIPENFNDVAKAYFDGTLTRKQAADELGVGLSTFDSWRKSHGSF